jgi:hypothetical protein
MTLLSELAPLVGQYRSGLEAEMALLRRIDVLSTEQREVARTGPMERLVRITEERERLMAALVEIEHGLKPIRAKLAQARRQLSGLVEFKEVAAIHREAADLASAILTADRQSVEALQEAEFARRAAAQALEQGESTLAAYRRVVAPPIGSPTLVNKRG